MAILVPMIAGLKKAAARAWPDAVGFGIYREETLESIPWEQLPEQYAGIAVSSFGRADVGAGQIGFAGKATFFFVGRWGGLGQDDALLSRADDMLVWLLNNATEGFQVWWEDERGIGWGKEIEANDVLASKIANHRVVQFSCTIVIGYC